MGYYHHVFVYHHKYHLSMEAVNVTESVFVLLAGKDPVIAPIFLSEPTGIAVPIGTGLGLMLVR
jgi:hypothetical protein